MNANLPPKTPATNSVSDWLRYAASLVAVSGSPSPELDSEVLLTHLLGVSRTFLRAHPEYEITNRQADIYQAMVSLRKSRIPVAYITGHKQFYGRNFLVTPDVLIPRPESETIINILKTLHSPKRFIDIGCGSGCLGITAKLEYPEIDITLLDVSSSALLVAKKNVATYKIEAEVVQGNLLKNIGDKEYDVMIANLPYVDTAWQTSEELKHEPAIALYAKNEGLELIFTLIEQAKDNLSKDGYLILESDPVQHTSIIANAKNHGLKHIQTVDYITVFANA